MDLKIFELELYDAGLANRTVRHHIQRAKYFLSMFDGEITAEKVKEWKISVRTESGWKNNSVNSYIKTIRKLGEVFDIPSLREIRFLPVNATDKPTMTADEIRQFLMLECPYKRPSQNTIERYYMFTIFFYVCAFTGRRPDAVARLTKSNIDFVRESITFTENKVERYGAGMQHITISRDLKTILKEYVEGLDRDELFVGCRQHNWQKNFKLRLKQMGLVRKGLTAYSLRHSFATRLYDIDGVDLLDIQKLMGHKKIETTTKYIHLDSKRYRKIIEKDTLNRADAESELARLKELVQAEKDNKYLDIKVIESNGSITFKASLRVT